MTLSDQPHRPLTSTPFVAARIAEIRKRRVWTAVQLAERCAAAGFPELNRSVIANIESGRRNYVTVDELLRLADVLDVAPVHLLVPIEVADKGPWAEQGLEHPGAWGYGAEMWLTFATAREWIRGRWCPPWADARHYWSQVPSKEWDDRPEPARQLELSEVWHAADDGGPEPVLDLTGAKVWPAPAEEESI